MRRGKVCFMALLMALSAPAHGAHAGSVSGETAEAFKLKPDPANGAKIYANACAHDCHGPNGHGDAEGNFPQIAGQLWTVCVKQIADIRSKNRDAPDMYPFALYEHVGGAQGIADVCAHVAKLPMRKSLTHGPGDNLNQGKKVYDQRCARCHGPKGGGDSAKAYPRIQGQAFEYLIRQMLAIRSGQRKNADAEMTGVMHVLSLNETSSVADYVSRFPADPAASKR
ncbi:MAG: c-type cytochrome [Nitrospinae bacterium]|nr:c-type cytochrome [Nitrospinota bacterium]